MALDCCNMYEIYDGKIRNMLKLKIMLGPWTNAIYSLEGGEKVLKPCSVLPSALLKTQFSEYRGFFSFCFCNSPFRERTC